MVDFLCVICVFDNGFFMGSDAGGLMILYVQASSAEGP